jgi:pimeloyl-ACP methyl ester carboxylesterase
MQRLFTLLLLCLALSVHAASDGPRLEEFQYPFEVHFFHFTSQNQPLEMAYMDLSRPGSNAPVVVLLHGKNFSGATWDRTAAALHEAGFRVVIPDQLGFGKSSKPQAYQFSFQQLASNTRELLHSLGVTNAQILGHSLGGMLAFRYALMYPSETRALILVDPLGLEDWKAKGVPYATLDRLYRQELNKAPETVRAYELQNYYGGKWQPEYDRWIDLFAAFKRSPDYPQMAWDQALTSDMIFTQPVCYEFNQLSMPVLLLIGLADRTAPSREQASPELQKALGDYPTLGRTAAIAIPHATLVEFPGLGHAPQLQDFPRFIQPVKEFLNKAEAPR